MDGFQIVIAAIAFSYGIALVGCLLCIAGAKLGGRR